MSPYNYGLNTPSMVNGDTMWWCLECDRLLPEQDFHRQRSAARGFMGTCKSCTLNLKKKRRRRHSQADAHVRAWNRANATTKQAIRMILKYAVSGGLVANPSTCSRCGSTYGIQAHHHEYSLAAATDVEWLCGRCHRAVHRDEPTPTVYTNV